MNSKVSHVKPAAVVGGLWPPPPGLEGAGTLPRSHTWPSGGTPLGLQGVRGQGRPVQTRSKGL